MRVIHIQSPPAGRTTWCGLEAAQVSSTLYQEVAREIEQHSIKYGKRHTQVCPDCLAESAVRKGKALYTIVVPRTRIRRPRVGDVVNVRGFLSGETCGHVHKTERAMRQCEARKAPWYTEHHFWQVEPIPGEPRRVRLLREVAP